MQQAHLHPRAGEAAVTVAGAAEAEVIGAASAEAVISAEAAPVETGDLIVVRGSLFVAGCAKNN